MLGQFKVSFRCRPYSDTKPGEIWLECATALQFRRQSCQGLHEVSVTLPLTNRSRTAKPELVTLTQVRRQMVNREGLSPVPRPGPPLYGPGRRPLHFSLGAYFCHVDSRPQQAVSPSFAQAAIRRRTAGKHTIYIGPSATRVSQVLSDYLLLAYFCTPTCIGTHLRRRHRYLCLIPAGWLCRVAKSMVQRNPSLILICIPLHIWA